jgi:hypothetical protein
METNTTTLLFKEPTNAKVMKRLILTLIQQMQVLIVVENCFYPTPPTTCVSHQDQDKICVHKLRRKKLIFLEG